MVWLLPVLKMKRKGKEMEGKHEGKHTPNHIHSVITDVYSTLKTTDVDRNLRQFLLWNVQKGLMFLIWKGFYAENQGDELT